MFDHYRRSSIGVEHLSSVAASGSGFWSSTNAWLSPNTAGFQRRRSSHPKICTFECAYCRKLMLSSVSERNLAAIDSEGSLSNNDHHLGPKSIEQSQSLTNSDQQLSSISLSTSASSTPVIHTTSILQEVNSLTNDLKAAFDRVNGVQQKQLQPKHVLSESKC